MTSKHLFCLPGITALLIACTPAAGITGDTADDTLLMDQMKYGENLYYADMADDTYGLDTGAEIVLPEQFRLQNLQQQFMLAQNSTLRASDISVQLKESVEAQDRFLNEAKSAYEAAYGLVLDEDWKNAVSSFIAFKKKYADSPWTDDAEFWQCYAEEKGGFAKSETAFTNYQIFIENYPGSNWVDDAKSNMIRLARTIEQSGDPAYRAVIQDMQANEEEQLVLTAIMALQSTGDDETVKALTDIYDKSTNSAVRERILYALGSSQTQSAIDKLVDIAHRDRSEDLRTKAITVLGKAVMPYMRVSSQVPPTTRVSGLIFTQDSPREYTPYFDVEALIATLKDFALTDTNSNVRRQAFQVLASMPAGRNLDFIIETAKSGNDYNIRRMAIEALGRSNDPRARETLIDIINAQQ